MEKRIINLKDIKYWILDVDGTMTDGSIYYDENGNELKKFNTKDAAGFFAIHAMDMKIIVLTGRECKATTRRMEEMKVDHLCQNIKQKVQFLNEFIVEHNISTNELAYIGDDLNDLQAMQMTGFRACPADACEEVKACSDYVSSIKGGQGVIRDVVEYVLKELNQWDEAVNKAYGLGV